MDAGLERIGEVGDIEECIFTKESRGLPSNSGSGRDPNLELFDADRPRPVPVEKEPCGDMMKPAGENPPDRAAELTSTIDEAFDTCLEIGDKLCEDNREDLRLSERLSSLCKSFMASSIELVMLNRSAVFSSCWMFPVYAP
jgi:hypothetical protein